MIQTKRWQGSHPQLLGGQVGHKCNNNPPAFEKRLKDLELLADPLLTISILKILLIFIAMC